MTNSPQSCSAGSTEVTDLQQAQAAYDTAIQKQRAAADAASAASSAVFEAKKQLDIAKQYLAATVPVDRSARQLSGGGAVTDDHCEINPATGQQKGYVVLSEAERSKGYVRPFRDAYRHLKCGAITTMSRDIAATYARDPEFYDGTFCSTCRSHFPVGEKGQFTWYEMDGSEGPKVGT
jgi:hypothetical protein